MSETTLSASERADLEADLAYHERMAATIRARLNAAATAGENLVAPADACPGCGERDPDRLEWMNDEDNQVRCAGCGFTYAPASHPKARGD